MVGSLFNTFRKSETKEEAISHLWKTVGSHTKSFAAEKFQSLDGNFGEIAQNVANSFVSSAVTGLVTGEMKAFQMIPALIDGVLSGVMAWFESKGPDINFNPGEWVSIVSGFHKDSKEVQFADAAMFQDDGDEFEKPIYDVAFFINLSTKEDCVVFDIKQGKIRTVNYKDVRLIPDQDALDSNTFLRDLKLLYFKEEGREEIAKTAKEVSVGKEVQFQNKLWEILEFNPVKKLVSLVKDNKVVKTTLSALENLDASNHLTWLGTQTMTAFPKTLEKYGYAWQTGENNEKLVCIKLLSGKKAVVVQCDSADTLDCMSFELNPISEKFKNVIINVPEFRRFRNAVIRDHKPIKIFTFDHLCTQSHQNREIDKMNKTKIQVRHDQEKKVFGVVDADLEDKVREMELAYNESMEVVEDENHFQVIVPKNVY